MKYIYYLIVYKWIVCFIWFVRRQRGHSSALALYTVHCNRIKRRHKIPSCLDYFYIAKRINKYRTSIKMTSNSLYWNRLRERRTYEPCWKFDRWFRERTPVPYCWRNNSTNIISRVIKYRLYIRTLWLSAVATFSQHSQAKSAACV